MKHAREDYDRLQDPEHMIPVDEPVFLLRAQDVAAPHTVEYWADLAEDFGAEELIIKRALEQAERMREWQRAHGLKIPDMPEDA